MKRCVMRGIKWLTIFNVKVTAKAYIIKMRLFFTISSKTVAPFATKLDFIVQHHKPECPVKKMDRCHSNGSKY